MQLSYLPAVKLRQNNLITLHFNKTTNAALWEHDGPQHVLQLPYFLNSSAKMPQKVGRIVNLD